MERATVAISIDALKAMAAAGATIDVIIAAVAAEQQAADQARAARREKDAERQRKSRASKPSHGQSVTPRDITDDPQVIDLAARAATTTRGQAASDQKGAGEGAHIDILTALPFSLSSDEGSKKDSSSVVARARRLPSDWSLSDADRAFARTLLTEDRITIEFDKFRDHWAASSGRNAVKRDWSAAWRNWCRNSNGGGNGPYRNSGGKGGGVGFTELSGMFDRADRP